MSTTSFFLGANTSNGFYSLFDELYNPYDNWNMYIIKGGPGTGKSSLMKKIAKEAENKELDVEYIYCSSDPLSLDAIIIKELKVSVADGTSPHTMEPKFPGVCEHMINLGSYWNKNKLAINTDKIKDIAMINSNYHKKSVQYLKTAKLIDNEIKNLTTNTFNIVKTQNFISRLCLKDIYKTDKDSGKIYKRFLSGITPLGIVVKYDSIFNTCDKIITIHDKYSYASEYILNGINEYANKHNIDRILCYCPTEPDKKIEHIIFPNLRLCIYTSNPYHPMIKKEYKNIHSERFYDKTMISDSKNKLNFLNKTKLELIGESIKSLQQAKASHDILESYYIAAMNFNEVSTEIDKLKSEIFK